LPLGALPNFSIRWKIVLDVIGKPKKKFSPGPSEVTWRYSGAGDDPRVQFFEQGEAGLFRRAKEERELKHNEVPEVIPNPRSYRCAARRGTVPGEVG
jgi:hypothetical protein